MEIMTIALFAVPSGADGFQAIETRFVKQWLASFAVGSMGYRRTIPLTGVCSTGFEELYYQLF